MGSISTSHSWLSLPPCILPSHYPSLSTSSLPPLDKVARIVDLGLQYRDRGVVGVDIAGNELLPLDPKHIAGFKRAKENGLHVTAHAGESGPASNVRQVSWHGN